MVSTVWSRRFLAVVASLVVVTALMVNAAMAESGCKPVSGNVTFTQASGPECLSPIDLCAAGTFTGGIKGTLAFTATSIVQAADTPTTGAGTPPLGWLP